MASKRFPGMSAETNVQLKAKYWHNEVDVRSSRRVFQTPSPAVNNRSWSVTSRDGQARIKVGVGPMHCTTVGPSVSHLSPSTHC